MEKILEDYLNTFVKENRLEHLKKDVTFEAFITFCTLSRMVSDTIDLDTVMVGEDGNLGIDGLAVIVNDHIVSSIEEIEYHKNNLRRLDVRFVFIQAKSSEKFDMGDMGKFIFG